MITPPRTIELLLASLAADIDFRDVVMGDLAEEFAQRVDHEGAGAARRWYYREAMRATPHLAYSSLRRMGIKGVWHRLGIVLSAYTIMLVTSLVPLSIVSSVALRFGGWRTLWIQVWQSTPAMVGLLAMQLAMVVFGGFVAAVFDDETPLISAGMLGTLWPSVVLAGG